ncbi:MAG: hypothetical protein ABIP97_02735 [Chthoniobacterales bacterium]
MENDTSNQAWDYPLRADKSGDSREAEAILWRPWPCAQCSQDATPLDFLRRCQEAGGEYPTGEWNNFIDEIRPIERARLAKWVEKCPHTLEKKIEFPKLAQGSEHVVFLDESKADVIKVTLPNCFGDFYYLQDGKVVQAECSPLMYLDRLRGWRSVLGNAPSAVGVTREGRIVSTQKFVQGVAATMSEVNAYLRSEGFQAVSESCFLWKTKDSKNNQEIWLGDARDENFVKSEGHIVPIDIRVWWMETSL